MKSHALQTKEQAALESERTPHQIRNEANLYTSFRVKYVEQSLLPILYHQRKLLIKPANKDFDTS
jgi:hypothetical protein